VAAEEPRMRALVRASVKGGRLRVLEAADRESVIAMARREQPRVALLDWEMSGGSAAEICSALRDHPETAGIKIVTMTTRAQAGRAATPSGADDSILKPFSPLQLLYKLRDLLGVDLVES
jgi:CheY-like chemotaxis protein